MEFIERIDIAKIQYLNSLTFSEFKELCPKAYKNEEERKRQFDNLKQFCKTNLKTDGVTKRIYSYSSDTPIELGGRLYCGNGIQNLPKQIRGFVATNLTDVDMKNAHPKILQYLCKQHNIPCPQLEYYNNHRDKILSEFEDASAAKTLFLKAVNDCKPLSSAVKNKFLRDFDKEMKTIQKTLTSLPEYCQIKEAVPELMKIKNWNGSAINRILCMYENKFLQAAMSAANRRNFEISTPMFDGFMFYGNHYDDKEFLEYLRDEVEKLFPGLNMIWAYKAHDISIRIPDDFDATTTFQAHDLSDCVKSDLEAAEKVFSLYPHWVFCNDQLFVFNQDTGMWDSCHTAHLFIIKSLSDRLHTTKTIKDGVARSELSYGNTKNLMERLPTLLKTMCRNDDWLKQSQYSSLGKLLFENGYMDLREQKFYSKTEHGFNPKIVFMGKIHHDFETFSDEDMDYVQGIKQRLFYNVLGKDVGNYLILNLARGLAGDMMKRMVFGLGETNSGKSILTKAVTLSCGDYVDSFNAENLAYRNSSQDEAQIMRWAMLLRWKRIVFSNEVKSTVELNGNMLKKVTSGGDSLIGRMHCGLETSFITHFLPVVLANDLPKIKPYDSAVNSRVRVVGYKKTFVDEPENEFELKKDNNLDDELQTLRFQKCFVGILIWEYAFFIQNGKMEVEPEDVIAAKQEWIGQEANYIEKFLGDFEITDDKSDFVASQQIEAWLTGHNLGITMKKFGVDIAKECKIRGHTNVRTDVKSVSGKKIRGWFGIKMLGVTGNG